MKRMFGQLIVIMFVIAALPAVAHGAEREYPVSGTVYAKTKGVTAKHVTEASGEDPEMKFTYFVCIQRDPRKDRYKDNWLAYRQCWDTTQEVWDAVEVCDWFMVKDAQIKDQATRPSAKTFAKKRRQEAKEIRDFDKCK